MGHTFPKLIRLFLIATLVVGGIIAHAGSVAHAATGDSDRGHVHGTHTETSNSAEAGLPDSSDPSHALDFCVDAHCCTPAVHAAPQNLIRQFLEQGKLAIAVSPDYALSIADSLLRPPRAVI